MYSLFLLNVHSTYNYNSSVGYPKKLLIILGIILSIYSLIIIFSGPFFGFSSYSLEYKELYIASNCIGNLDTWYIPIVGLYDVICPIITIYLFLRLIKYTNPQQNVTK